MYEKFRENTYFIPPGDRDSTIEAVLASERTLIVRLCMHLIGNAEAAEDLAQETMLEAWKNRWKIDARSDREGLKKWLFAIARNICMRWARSHSSDLIHLALPEQYEDETERSIEDIPDDFDVELELERGELAYLLDRALALLPATVRDVLIERYIHESSHREIAERLGLSEDALVQRLYRGKLALRRVITTKMGEEASTFGMALTDEERLQQETRIWCPLCGTHRLTKRFDSSTGRTHFSCPHCMHIATAVNPQVLSGVKSTRPMLTQQLAQLHDYYKQAIHVGRGICCECGGITDAVICQPQNIPQINQLWDAPAAYHGVNILCTSCHNNDTNMLPHLTLDTPEARQFWRKHPRMQWHPGYEIEYAGQPALVSSFRSKNELAQLDLIYQRDTLVILNVHESLHP